jgi:hypothetical protein
MNFTSPQIKSKFKQFSKKEKLGPDLTEPGRAATGRPSFDTARAGAAISNC